MTLWWLSFADPKRPRGLQFLGVAIVEADEFIPAVERAIKDGINPGGDVKGARVPEFLPRPPSNYVGRLLTRDEATVAEAYINGRVN